VLGAAVVAVAGEFLWCARGFRGGGGDPPDLSQTAPAAAAACDSLRERDGWMQRQRRKRRASLPPTLFYWLAGFSYRAEPIHPVGSVQPSFDGPSS